MDGHARLEAQQRIKRIEAFREELAELEQESALTLTPEQRTRLEAHLEGALSRLAAQCDLDVTRSGRWTSWGVLAAAHLGAAAFCAALVLFLHRIWGSLPPIAHSATLLAAPLVVLAAAELTSRGKVRPYLTPLLALVAGVGFVLELSALFSISNIVPSAHMLLAWGVFATLVAYAHGLRLLLGAGLLLLCAYTASLFAVVEGAYWLDFLERPESVLPAALVVYALPSLTSHRDRHDFGFVFRLSGAAWALVAVMVLSLVGRMSYLSISERTIEMIYQVLGLAFSAGVVFHGVRLGRAGMVNVGAMSFVAFLYVKLYAWWWAWMPKYLFFLLIGLAAVLLLFLFRRLRARVTRRTQP